MNKLVTALVLMFFFTAFAENLGQKANTYSVDQDARIQLKAIMAERVQSGDVERYQKHQLAVLKAKLHNFGDLGLVTHTSYKAELRELVFTVPKDFKDASGATVAKRGTVIRPLERVVLQNGLIFIDGTDQAQINYAVQRANTEHLRIVLTKGSPYELRIKYKNTPFRGGKSIPFYFDQDGAIIKTLHLTYALDILSVPTTLTQRGTKLFVETGVRS
jgi:conjugal transfer pilus assembly protein TraW